MNPWRRARQPTPVFLPGESHGQRNLVGYSPWGLKEPDTTEATWQALEGRRQHSVGQHLCSDAMDHCLPGPSVHGILQARILEWVAMPSSRGSSPPKDRTQVSCISRQVGKRPCCGLIVPVVQAGRMRTAGFAGMAFSPRTHD